jgi:hypothetical protein
MMKQSIKSFAVCWLTFIVRSFVRSFVASVPFITTSIIHDGLQSSQEHCLRRGPLSGTTHSGSASKAMIVILDGITFQVIQ